MGWGYGITRGFEETKKGLNSVEDSNLSLAYVLDRNALGYNKLYIYL